MKSLSSYIFENINNLILESKLGKADLSKHQNNYIYQLLNYIISGGKTQQDVNDKKYDNKELGNNNKLPRYQIKFIKGQDSVDLKPEWFNIGKIKKLKTSVESNKFVYSYWLSKTNESLLDNIIDIMEDNEFYEALDSEEFLPDKFHFALFYCLTDEGLKELNTLYTKNYYKLFNITYSVNQKRVKSKKQIITDADDKNIIINGKNLSSIWNKISSKYKKDNENSIHSISNFIDLNTINKKINQELSDTNEEFALYKIIWTKLDKSAFTNIKITTKNQEEGTCYIFNYISENKDIKEIDSSLIKNILTENNLVNVASDDKWIKSYEYQIPAIIKIAKQLGPDWHDFVLKRYDTNAKGFVGMYSNLSKNYAKLLNGNKDNYDPSDILLFNKNIKDISELSELSDKLKLNNDEKSKEIKDIQRYKTIYNELYKSNLFRGISLKQLSDEPEIELFNYTADYSIDNIQLEKQSDGNYYHISKSSDKKEGNSISVFFTCDINTKSKQNIDTKITNGNEINPSNEDKGIEYKKQLKYKLSLRTFGKYIAMDIAIANGLSGKISLGKSSKNVWGNIFKEVIKTANMPDYLEKEVSKSFSIKEYSTRIDSGEKKYISDMQSIFKALVDLTKDKDSKNYIKDIANSALKFGPDCLPYIIIH